LEFGVGAGVKKTGMMGLPGPEKKFNDVFSRIDAIHERDGWRWTDGLADGRTPADSKDRAYA